MALVEYSSAIKVKKLWIPAVTTCMDLTGIIVSEKMTILQRWKTGGLVAKG